MADRNEMRESHPDSWIPVEANDYLIGKVTDVTEAWSDKRQGGSFYPLLTVEVENATGYSAEMLPGSGELRVHCFGTVLYNEVMKHQPEVGERIRIIYLGKSEKENRFGNPPELYRLTVTGRKDAAKRAYARIGAGAVQVPGSQGGEPVAQPAPAEPEQMQIADDDIPF